MQHHEEAEDEVWIYSGQKEVPATVRRVKIAETVTRIPDEAFRLHQLEIVTLSSSIQVIGKDAFSLCEQLKSILFQPLDGKEEVDIPSNVKVIDDEAFAGCYNLEEFVLNEGLERIGRYAFCQCESLTGMEIPSTVNVIDGHAFQDCRHLARLGLNEGLERIGKGAFYRCESLTRMEIPSTVNVIDDHAFGYCERLARLGLNEGLERIGQGAFTYCESLTEVNFPSTVKVIGNSAFHACKLLKRLGLNEGLERIGNGAFKACYSLSHVRIPQGVYSIADTAFVQCRSLISIEHPEECSFDIELSGCRSLVSVAGRISIFSREVDRDEFFQSSKLGSLVDNEADLIRRLNHRFDNSPLNQLCYYQSYHSHENAMAQLRSVMGENPLAATNQTDEFGMTPLHILSLSQTPNVDMLLAVMKAGQRDHIIYGRDSFESTPMDYFCLNRMPSSKEVVGKVLLKRFDELLGLDRSLESEMLQAIDEACKVDWPSRRREIVAMYLKLANHERSEIVSVIESFLWKIKEQIREGESCEEIKSDVYSDEIKHVLSFCDNLDVEAYFVSYPDQFELANEGEEDSSAPDQLEFADEEEDSWADY